MLTVVLVQVKKFTQEISSVGRAPPLQGGCHRFESGISYQIFAAPLAPKIFLSTLRRCRSKNHRNHGGFCVSGVCQLVQMSRVIPLSKNYKDYEDVPDGLKWAIPIHECLERLEVKEASKGVADAAEAWVEREFAETAKAVRRKKISVAE